MMDDAAFRQAGIKALVLVGPLFASAMAVCYDVGFFFGADIGFFTFFSFAEHLVFALQALPFAVPAVLMILCLLMTLWRVYFVTPREVEEFVEKYRAMPEEEKASVSNKLRRSVARHRRWNPYVQTGVVILAIVSLMTHNYVTPFLLIVTQVTLTIGLHKDNLESKNVQVALAPICGTSALVAAFLLGIERTDKILKSTIPTERIFIEGSEIPVRLVRAGDRGLLFFSTESKKLGFFRWDAIKKIETF